VDAVRVEGLSGGKAENCPVGGGVEKGPCDEGRRDAFGCCGSCWWEHGALASRTQCANDAAINRAGRAKAAPKSGARTAMEMAGGAAAFRIRGSEAFGRRVDVLKLPAPEREATTLGHAEMLER
jgi:hypothetical protein